MKTLMTTLLLAGTALMAQTGTAPTPAAGSASSTTPAPAKVKKHHAKAKTTAPGSSTANAAPEKK
jgi:hypothetical protein